MTESSVKVREGRGHASALSNQSLHLPGEWERIQAVERSSEFLLPVGTSWVSRDVLGIAEEVEAMTGGRCRVASCNCGRCTSLGHYPHVVVELSKTGKTTPVFGVMQLGPHVLQRLREIHVSNNPNKRAMKKNAEIRARQKQKFHEASEEKRDILVSALQSHKFDYRGPGGLRTRA